MYDLSWLNPTPHAIAVYASQPLSPVATQHSLPSGRYSLLGPDFHRLDRTSLWLAHLFDHLGGPNKEGLRHGEAKRLGGLEVDHKLIFCWLLHWQIRRLFAFKNTIDVGRRAPEDVRGLNPIEDKAAINDERAPAFAATPCWRATRLTVMPGSKVSPTMRTFSEAVQRRRR